jgi:hypothetical protein
MKINSKILALSTIGAASAVFAAVMTIDSTPATLENAPNCSQGIKKLSPDPSFSSIFSNGTFYGCFTNPKKFKIKIYDIALVDGSGNETSIYSNANPDYVDIIGNKHNPVRDLTALASGTYTKIKLVVDANYQILIDESIPSFNGTSSRVITKPSGKPSGWVVQSGYNWITPFNNAGVTGNGNPNLKYVFPRDSSSTAEPMTFLHQAFLLGSTNMTLSNQGYNLYYTPPGSSGGGIVGLDSTTNCNFIELAGTRTDFCTAAEKATLSRVTTGTGQYPLQADWNTSGSSTTISQITHSIDKDYNGNNLDYQVGYDENNQWIYSPARNVGRSTITMTLTNPLVYDDTKGVVINWKWITKKLFFVGLYASDLDSGSSDTVNFVGIGPYSLNLKITSVERKSSGKTEVEAKQ